MRDEDGTLDTGSYDLSRRQEIRAPSRRIWGAGLAGALVGAAAFGLGVLMLNRYDDALFLFTPTVMGFTAGLVLNWRQSYAASSVLKSAAASVLLAAAILLVAAMEGAICVLMALPLAIPAALLGGVLSIPVTHDWNGRTLVLALALLPVLFGAQAALEQYPVRPVTTSVDINATPQQVWEHVVAFSPLPPPTEWLFHTGIAYPVRARLEGSGVGAIRYCEFSTGPFVEPITVWEPGQRLGFDVTAQPLPMRELSPYPEIDAPHLLHGLESQRGEFLLTTLPDGRTRLTGTTWYRVNMGPQWYWRLWSDHVIGTIHHRVLRHIKTSAEG